jgi:hypothetical protein
MRRFIWHVAHSDICTPGAPLNSYLIKTSAAGYFQGRWEGIDHQLLKE